MSATPETELQTRYDWHHFVARSGPEGRHWVRQYAAEEPQHLVVGTYRALDLLRSQRLKEGLDLLQSVQDRIEELELSEESLYWVLRRFYLSAIAYYHYCVHEFDQAGRTLDEADESVRKMLAGKPWLIPLANHCHDFQLQRVRIARNRQRWREMRQHVERIRRMMADEEPLCKLEDGSTVFYADIARFYLAIPDLSEAERSSVRYYVDKPFRLRRLERFIQGIYASPGLVIPYR